MPVYTQDDFAVNLNSGYLGVGWNFPKEYEYNFGLSISLLNIGMEHKPTNIGFEFSPFYSWTAADATDLDNEEYSFFNLNLYWNVFTLLEEAVFFGTFVSVNYLFVREDVFWDKYIFTAGGHIGFRINLDKIYYNLISTEIGYRNINGIGKYFVGIKIDMAAFFLFLLYAKSEE